MTQLANIDMVFLNTTAKAVNGKLARVTDEEFIYVFDAVENVAAFTSTCRTYGYVIQTKSGKKTSFTYVQVSKR